VRDGVVGHRIGGTALVDTTDEWPVDVSGGDVDEVAGPRVECRVDQTVRTPDGLLPRKIRVIAYVLVDDPGAVHQRIDLGEVGPVPRRLVREVEDHVVTIPAAHLDDLVIVLEEADDRRPDEPTHSCHSDSQRVTSTVYLVLGNAQLACPNLLLDSQADVDDPACLAAS
jgi:hypothetical protein